MEEDCLEGWEIARRVVGNLETGCWVWISLSLALISLGKPGRKNHMERWINMWLLEWLPILISPCPLAELSTVIQLNWEEKAMNATLGSCKKTKGVCICVGGGGELKSEHLFCITYLKNETEITSFWYITFEDKERIQDTLQFFIFGVCTFHSGFKLNFSYIIKLWLKHVACFLKCSWDVSLPTG